MVFGSELKCLAAVPGVCGSIDPTAIDEFLMYQYIPHPRTIWKNVNKLPPGHFAVYENGQLRVERYWNFDPSIERPISQKDAAERLRELLTDSVRLRLQSDVPLGTFLSGGIDSSLITSIAQSLKDEPVRTFSIGFPNREFDETQYAARVAKFLKTDHVRFEVTPSAIDLLDQLAWHYDEPFGDSSAVPTWYLSGLTRKEVTVALSGDGGDELFAGYERYRALWLSGLIQRYLPLHRIPGLGLIQKLPDSNRRRSLVRRGKRFVEALGQSTVRRYLNWLQIFPESLRAELYNDSFFETLPDHDPIEFLEQSWAKTAGRDVVTRASLTDVLTYLPCDLMCKVDIASMAHGLEVRQPMLDYRVVEFAASLPVKYKFRRSRGKLILQYAFGSMIPAEIWTRKKMGFGVPIVTWFREELRERVRDVLLAPNARISEFFRPEAVRGLVDSHQRGETNHSYRLWNLLMLESWLNRWRHE
jgi:asparagine synthase (glutamine-hydrolysing)